MSQDLPNKAFLCPFIFLPSLMPLMAPPNLLPLFLLESPVYTRDLNANSMFSQSLLLLPNKPVCQNQSSFLLFVVLMTRTPTAAPFFFRFPWSSPPKALRGPESIAQLPLASTAHRLAFLRETAESHGLTGFAKSILERQFYSPICEHQRWSSQLFPRLALCQTFLF